ncbi:MAG: radical SAM protein [Methanophagales archaeon ANME-1-THS]|nr:MAG: radical SAM protein [Methanophagales archaeon ANME-1-THS]
MDICRANKRKYYRFRADRFYGGIATADCMGCNLDCAFCWSYRTRIHPERIGTFYAPEEVAQRLVRIAREHGFRAVRISGNEPTLCTAHLLAVIQTVEQLDPSLLFVLETNGIKLGEDEPFAGALATCPNLHVRVSFKTGTPENFELITTRPREWFELQLRAVEHLHTHNASFHVAVIAEYAHEYLLQRLGLISPAILKSLEYEQLTIHPSIQRRMKERGLLELQRRI